jgi:hypothetical protein
MHACAIRKDLGVPRPEGIRIDLAAAMQRIQPSAGATEPRRFGAAPA